MQPSSSTPNLRTLRTFRVLLSASAAVLFAGLASNLKAAPTYHLGKTIAVGGEGGWDYLSVDAAAHRLFASHGTHIVVIDTKTDLVVGDIADTPGVHGIAVADGLGRGFVSNGRDNSVGIVDLATLKVLRRVQTGKNPDAIAYAPPTGEVYAFNGRSSSATVIAAATGTVAATIPLPGKPEFAQCDPVAARVYVNLENKSEVALIDARTREVKAVWPLAPGEEPTGLALDSVHRRLFAGCANRCVTVLDADSGKVVATIPAGSGIDAVGFDSGTGLVFASNGRDGTLTIAHQDSADHYTVVQTLATALGARTLAVDPVSHKVYLSTAKFKGGKPGWKNMEPGTFEVLVAELNP